MHNYYKHHGKQGSQRKQLGGLLWMGWIGKTTKEAPFELWLC